VHRWWISHQGNRWWRVWSRQAHTDGLTGLQIYRLRLPRTFSSCILLRVPPEWADGYQ
jgi:hypothetical protein